MPESTMPLLIPRSPFHCVRHSHPDTTATTAAGTGSGTGASTTIVSVEKSEINSEAAPPHRSYATFTLTVTLRCQHCGSRSWSTAKRYSEFVDFHSALVNEIKSNSSLSVSVNDLPSLPPKKILGSSLDAEFLESRRLSLNQYLSRLCEMATLHGSKVMIGFLQEPHVDTLSVMAEAIAMLQRQNQSQAALMAEMKQQIDALTNPRSNTNTVHGSVSSNGQLEAALKELSKLKRRIRSLEAQKESFDSLLDDEADGTPLADIGRSRSHQTPLLAARSIRTNDDHAAAVWDRRRYRRLMAAALAAHQAAILAGVSVPPITNDSDDDDNGNRGRSLSESHLTDRLAMKHFHYRTTSAARQNPFLTNKRSLSTSAATTHAARHPQAQRHPTRESLLSSASFPSVTSIKEEDSPALTAPSVSQRWPALAIPQLFALTSRDRTLRHSDPIAAGSSHFHRVFAQAPDTDKSAASFFSAFGPTISTGVFGLSSQSQNHSVKPQVSKPTIADSEHANNASEAKEDGYESPHSELHVGSPSTQAMAAISEGVANAVLDATPSSSPFNSPAIQPSRAGHSSQSQSPAPSPTNATGGHRQRQSAVHKLPPPQLHLQQPSTGTNTSGGIANKSHKPEPSQPIAVPSANNANAAQHTASANTSNAFMRHIASNAYSPVIGSITPSDSPTSQSFTSTEHLSTSQSESPCIGPNPTDFTETLTTSDPLYVTCLDQELQDRINDLLLFIHPTPASESRYHSVLAFVESLIKKTIGAEVFCHGSFALKTYLPDADLDVSTFFNRNNDDSWVQRLVAALCQEAALTNVGGGKETMSPQHQSVSSLSSPTSHTHSRDTRFAVKSVTFVNAETQVIKCQIGHVSVDISANQTGALATLALFEEVDILVGDSHLFKRTILLAKTWFKNECHIVGSHAGLLSSYCIRTFVLFIFNAYREHITNPLQGLYLLLCYLAVFDWSEHAFGLFGPIQLAALPKFSVVTNSVTSWPVNTQPLVTQSLLQSYSQMPPDSAVDSVTSAPRSFQPKYLNIIDPCNPLNNLGRSVSYQNVLTIRAAMTEGAVRLRQAIIAWSHRARLTPSMTPNTGSNTSDHDKPTLVTASSSLPLDASHALLRSSSQTSEEMEYSQAEFDQREAFRIVSLLFGKTLAVYSGRQSFGMRSRSARPKARTAALAIIGLDSEPVTASPRSSLTPSVSAPASPVPALRHTGTVNGDSNLLLAEDSEFDTETESSSLPRSLHTHAPTIPVPQFEILDGNLPSVLESIRHARQFDSPDVSEAELIAVIRKIIAQCGSVPVGKLGSLLHNVMNNHTLPAMLKEKFGGLKKFLERHTAHFLIGQDHPFNPHVYLAEDTQAPAMPQGGMEQAVAALMADATLLPPPPPPPSVAVPMSIPVTNNQHRPDRRPHPGGGRGNGRSPNTGNGSMSDGHSSHAPRDRRRMDDDQPRYQPHSQSKPMNGQWNGNGAVNSGSVLRPHSNVPAQRSYASIANNHHPHHQHQHHQQRNGVGALNSTAQSFVSSFNPAHNHGHSHNHSHSPNSNGS